MPRDPCVSVDDSWQGRPAREWLAPVTAFCLKLVKVVAPFFLAAAWSQFFASLLDMAAPEASEMVGQPIFAGIFIAYAAALYLIAAAIAVLLMRCLDAAAADVAVAFFGHVLGFAFRDASIGLLAAWVPCSLVLPFTLSNFAASAGIMLVLSLLRRQGALDEALSELEGDAFGMLCGWNLNNCVHVGLAAATYSEIRTAGLWAAYTIIIANLAAKVVVRGDTSSLARDTSSPLRRRLVTHWLGLSFMGWSLTLGWTSSSLTTALLAPLLANLSLGPLSTAAVTASVLTVVGGCLIAFNDWCMARGQGRMTASLQGLLQAQPHAAWPPLVERWNRLGSYVPIGKVVKLLQREGAALVCSSCPCGSFLGKAWPVMMVKVPPTGRRWLYRRVLRLVSVWAPRRLTLEVRDSCIRECGIVQDSAGRWGTYKHVKTMKRAAIRGVAWGFVIGWSWESYFDGLITRATRSEEEEEPRFYYCRETPGQGVVPAPDGEPPAPEETGEGGGDVLPMEAWLAVLAKLGFAVGSTLLIAPILWWLAFKEEQEEEEADGEEEEEEGSKAGCVTDGAAEPGSPVKPYAAMPIDDASPNVI